MQDDGMLFDVGKSWENDWDGMPEFSHEDLTPRRSIIVHFASDADVKKFAEIVGQRISPKTRSLWYPEAEIGHMIYKVYSDSESDGGK